MSSKHGLSNNRRKSNSKQAHSPSEGYFNRKKNSKSQIFETSDKNWLLADPKHEYDTKDKELHNLALKTTAKKGTGSGLEMMRMSYLNGISEDTIRGSRCVVGDKRVKKKMIQAIKARKNNHFEHDDGLDTSQTRSKSEMTTKTGNSRRIKDRQTKNVKLYPTMRRTARYTAEKLKPLKLHRKSKNKKNYGHFRTVEMALKNSEKKRQKDLISSVDPTSKKEQDEKLLNIITEDEEELRQSEETFFPSLSKVADFRSFEDDARSPKEMGNCSSSGAEAKSSVSSDHTGSNSARKGYSKETRRYDKMAFSPSRFSQNSNSIFNLVPKSRAKRSTAKTKEEGSPSSTKLKEELKVLKQEVHKPQKSAQLDKPRIGKKRDFRISKEVKSKTTSVALKPRNQVGKSLSRNSSEDHSGENLKKNIKMIFKNPQKGVFRNENLKSRQKGALSKAVSHQIYTKVNHNQDDIDFTVGNTDNLHAGRNSIKLQSATQENFRPRMGKEEIFQLLYSKDYSKQSKYKRIPERRSSNDSKLLPNLNLNTLVNKQLGAKSEKKKMGRTSYAFMKTGSQGTIKPPNKKKTYDLSKLAMIQKVNTTPIISPKEYLRKLNSPSNDSGGILSISERGILGTLMKKAQEGKKKSLHDNLARLSTKNR